MKRIIFIFFVTFLTTSFLPAGKVINTLEQTWQTTKTRATDLWERAQDQAASLVQSAKQWVTGIDPYAKTPAQVRLSTELSQDELNFINERKPKTKEALEALLGQTLTNEQVPTIAFCFSGGGYRAMIETIGSLDAAEDLGLLQTALFMGALSGSTWALMSWVSSGKKIKAYRNHLHDVIGKNLFARFQKGTIKKAHIRLLAQELAAVISRKTLDRQPVYPVDIYGILLAGSLLDEKYQMHLTDLRYDLRRGRHPLPLATAVYGGIVNHRPWFEFSPFEIGSNELGMFIPSWALGRVFKKGASVLLPEGIYPWQQTLGYCMALWGSAFAIDLRFVMEAIIKELKSIAPSLAKVVKDTFEKMPKEVGSHLEQMSFGSAVVPNFAYGIEQENIYLIDYLFNKNAPLKDIKDLRLVDGGFDLIDDHYINLGIVPLLRPARKVDLIIVCDSSGIDMSQAPTLQAAAKRAHKLGLKFPKIEVTDPTKSAQVFMDENDPSVPTIIYLPGKKNDRYNPKFDPLKTNFTQTFNFEYSSNQFDRLSGLSDFILRENKELIIDTIRKIVERKSGK